jgi:hypothetical protein
LALNHQTAKIAAIAQSKASVQNEAMISATRESGQANLANLERLVMKDNTLLPGEWHGGQLYLQPLARRIAPIDRALVPPNKLLDKSLRLSTTRQVHVNPVHGRSQPGD